MQYSIEQMVACLEEGGVILIPTDTVFGLIAKADNPKGVEKIFDLKQRPKNRNLPIMVSNAEQLSSLGLAMNDNMNKLLASEFMPGALTIVAGFAGNPSVEWLEGREEIAFRIPDDEALLSLMNKVGPILATSANRHGNPTVFENVAGILKDLNGTPDIAIEGTNKTHKPSTIINCQLNPPKIEREGHLSKDVIFDYLNL